MKTLIARHKAGEHIGICSVCSAHPLVIEAALAFDRNSTRKVLIEATSNQVNQFGGYTGMTPADFREFVFTIADKVGFARERIILGGDHLGPNCWQQENADAAMEKSVELVKAYVRAGFSKIHLDASMSCAGDPIPLAPETVAERAAVLCFAAESVATDCQREQLSYVIGTEVPVPGGEASAIACEGVRCNVSRSGKADNVAVGTVQPRARDGARAEIGSVQARQANAATREACCCDVAAGRQVGDVVVGPRESGVRQCA